MLCGGDTGEVPNLFPKDELAGVLDEVRAAAKKQGAGETGDALYAFFLERVRTNLHVILCLSPIGEAFRERCRMFPGMRQDPHHCCQHCNRSCHTIHAQPNATDKVLDRRDSLGYGCQACHWFWRCRQVAWCPALPCTS